MRGLTPIAWRSIRARPLRTSLTTIGVALGVAVLVAGMATNTGLRASVDRTVAAMVGDADLRLTAFGEAGLSTATVKVVATTPGVAIVAPAVQRRTYLGLERFAPGDDLPAPVTITGIDPAAEASLHDMTLQAGDGLLDDDATGALVSPTLAREDGLAVGDELSVDGPTGAVEWTVRGVLASDGPWGGTTGRAVVVTLAGAEAALGPGGIGRVDIGLDPGTEVADVMIAIESTLLTEPYVISRPSDVAAALDASTAEFAATTALIAAIALFVGAFLIFNTLSMTVVERLRELGLLRAAGATRGQMTGFVLVQAAFIGLVGSLLGVLLGVGLATAMAAWVGRVGDVALDGPVILPGQVGAAVLIGLLVTLAAAAEPARRAGRIPPVEAIKARLDLQSARRARLRWLVAVFAAVGVAGILAWPGGVTDPGVTRAVVVYAALLLAAMAVPLLLPVLTRIAGAPFALLTRLEERLARASVLRDRPRAALTVGALTIGLAMVVALGGVAQHARSAAGSWIADVIPGDLVLTSIFPRATDEGIDEVLGSLPGVTTVTPLATFDLAVGGTRVDGAAVVGADLAADGRLHFVSGERVAALAAIDSGGSAIVPAALAARDGITVGDRLPVVAADGSAVDLTVVGVVERTLPGRTAESVLVGWADATRLGVAGADAFAVRFAPTADATQREALADEARALALEPVGLERIQGAVGEALDRVFGLFDALALIAVIVAMLGIVNTLTMNVLERVREIGILRAAGMTRRQVWRSVVVEAGVTGLAGAILGIIVGLGLGALMVVLAGGRFDAAIGIPWPAVALAAILGVVLAMLAAAYPARLASRITIVRAVGFE